MNSSLFIHMMKVRSHTKSKAHIFKLWTVCKLFKAFTNNQIMFVKFLPGSGLVKFPQMILGQPSLTEQIQDLKLSRSACSSSKSNAKSSAKRIFRSAVMLGTPGNSSDSYSMQVCQALNLLLLSESKIQFCLNDSLTQNLICTDNYMHIKYISFRTTGASLWWDSQFGLTMAEGVQEVFEKPTWKHYFCNFTSGTAITLLPSLP